MASIQRKNTVVYYYEDKETGERRQKWEKLPTLAEAKLRKTEIEYAQAKGTFVRPDNQTISEFLNDFVVLYGAVKWGPSYYESSVGLINNYINPILGNEKMQNIKQMTVVRFFEKLRKTKPVSVNNKKPKTEFLPPATLHAIHKLMKCAFARAVEWEVVGKNVFLGAVLPEVKSKKRDIWNADMIRKAFDCCTDPKLYLAMNLSFSTTARLGEVLGLEWKNVCIDEDSIARDDAHILITQEIQRVNIEAMRNTEKAKIMFQFPPLSNRQQNKTALVLKDLKNTTSERKVWLPKTVAYILREWKKRPGSCKGIYGA